jgi:hypothetical protein
MTEVYAARLAEEVGPGRMLVIKVLPDSVADDPDAESRFLAEARIVLNLTHGNIATAFEFGRDEAGRPFLVMEYIPGPSLRGLLSTIHQKGEQLRIEDSLFIMAEVSKALSYAHGFSSGGVEKGIIHRDISPDNIVISTSGQVKLTDFGIAHFVRARTYGPIFGKAAYIAPEVAGGGAPTGASDIYSVGAVLYECLAGSPPFKGKDDRETLQQVKKEPPAPFSTQREGISSELEELVLSLLEKSPDKRPSTAAEMEVRIRSLLRKHHASYTESDFARTINLHFSSSDFMDPTPRESLKKALAEAGVVLTGEETTDELLENRTVRLDAGVGARKKRETLLSGHAFKIAVLGSVLLIVSGGAVLLFGRSIARPDSAAELVDDTAPPAAQVAGAPSSVQSGEPNVIKKTTFKASDIEDTAGDTADSKPPVEKKHGKRITPQIDRPRASKRRDTDDVKQKVKNASSSAEQTEWGWLNINSYPWSYVKVDGRKLPGHTPHRRVKLKSGRHVLEFENPELKLKSQKTVEVSPWEEANIGVRLDQ